MGVTNTNAYDGPFYPNGITTSFPFTFRTMSTGEVKVVTADGAPITGLSFSIVPAMNADGGSIIFDSAPTAAQLPAFLIASAPIFGVGIDLGAVTAFNPRTLNPSFERLAVQNIFLQSLNGRAILAPLGEEPGSIPPLSQRGGKLALFSFDGGIAAIDTLGVGNPDIVDDGEWSIDGQVLDDGEWG